MAAPTVQASVYPTIQQIMDLARSFVNDAFQGGAGRILTNAAPFTLPYINEAQNELQSWLANNGVSTFIADNYLLLNVPPCPVTGSQIQVSIGYNGYDDGTNIHDEWRLPGDCVVPLVFEERGAGSPNKFTKMTQPMDSLESMNQGPTEHQWQWREDKIVMPGATTARDFRLRYERLLPDVNCQPQDFAQTVIPIRDSKRAMAWRVAYLFASARGAAQVAQLDLEYQKAAKKLIVRYTRRDQRIQYNRKEFGNRGGGVPIGIYK